MIPKGRVSRAIYAPTERADNELRTWLSSDLLSRFQGSRVSWTWNKARDFSSANASDSTKLAIPKSLLKLSARYGLAVEVVCLKAQSKIWPCPDNHVQGVAGDALWMNVRREGCSDIEQIAVFLWKTIILDKIELTVRSCPSHDKQHLS